MHPTKDDVRVQVEHCLHPIPEERNRHMQLPNFLSCPELASLSKEELQQEQHRLERMLIHFDRTGNEHEKAKMLLALDDIDQLLKVHELDPNVTIQWRDSQ